MIKVESLSVCYGKKTILENISFEIKDGEFVYLIGRNGIGKSSLLNSVAGINKYRTGKVNLNGDFPFLVSEEVDYPSSYSVDAVIETFSPFYSEYSNEVSESVLSNCTFKNRDKVGDLSRGQKIQLQLCLALASKSRVILVDEASALLDHETLQYMLKELKQLTAVGTSILFATNVQSDLSSQKRYLELTDKNRLNWVESAQDD